MPTLQTYLHFNGNTEQAFNFYKSVFGGEFEMVSRYADTPEGVPQHGAAANDILHIALRIGSHSLLMGTDTPKDFPPSATGGNYHIVVTTESEQECKQIYDALSVGGKIGMALDKTFWGAYFGMFTDQFGVNWMISYEYKQPQGQQ